MAVYVTAYPPAHNGTYVKATSNFDAHPPYYATDPAKSLTGESAGNAYLAAAAANQRLHVDLGAEKVVKRIYYENYHSAGQALTRGVKNFSIWGSNNAASFADLAYDHDTGWTQLSPAQSTMDPHIESDVADPRYIPIDNSAGYRYFALKFADCRGGDLLGVRRIELQALSFRPPIMVF